MTHFYLFIGKIRLFINLFLELSLTCQNCLENNSNNKLFKLQVNKAKKKKKHTKENFNKKVEKGKELFLILQIAWGKSQRVELEGKAAATTKGTIYFRHYVVIVYMSIDIWLNDM